MRKINTSKPYDVLADVPRNTEDIDRLWGIFLATGNKTAISQIISVLSLWEQGRGAAVAIGGATMWSLTKHANQHPTILQIVIAERDNSSGTQKKFWKKSSIKQKGTERFTIQPQPSGPVRTIIINS